MVILDSHFSCREGGRKKVSTAVRNADNGIDNGNGEWVNKRMKRESYVSSGVICSTIAGHLHAQCFHCNKLIF
jgi:hypothetical protein